MFLVKSVQIPNILNMQVAYAVDQCFQHFQAIDYFRAGINIREHKVLRDMKS